MNMGWRSWFRRRRIPAVTPTPDRSIENAPASSFESKRWKPCPSCSGLIDKEVLWQLEVERSDDLQSVLLEWPEDATVKTSPSQDRLSVADEPYLARKQEILRKLNLPASMEVRDIAASPQVILIGDVKYLRLLVLELSNRHGVRVRLTHRVGRPTAFVSAAQNAPAVASEAKREACQ